MMFDVKEHILKRHVDLNIHTVYLTDTKATFMLFNISGQITGYQVYSPLSPHLSSNSYSGRYYTHRSKFISIFGLETLKLNCKTVFLTEGIFDAVRLTKKGKCALALLTNSPNSSMLNFLYCLPQKRVLVSDNDKGGCFLRKSLTGIVHDVVVPPFKDLGEATEEYVEYVSTIYDT